MDPHHFGNQDPRRDPHKHQLKIRIRIHIRIHIKVIIWILNWIWIRVMVTSRIRTRIKVTEILNTGFSYLKSKLHGYCVQTNGVPAGGWWEGDGSWAPAALRPLQEGRRLQSVSFSALFSFQKKVFFLPQGWKKLKRTPQLQQYCLKKDFFWSKIVIYLSLGLHKRRPSNRRSPQKRTSSSSKNEIY